MTNVESTGRIDPSAVVESGASIGLDTSIWDLARIRAGAKIGRGCVIGRNAFIDHDVTIGDDCKIQNNALVYFPAVLGSGVFVGPGAIITNDRFPRAVNPSGVVSSSSDWVPLGVTVADGASLGAGCIVVAGATIGSWALVAAGSVVIDDVPAYSLVAGVPARWIHWIGRSAKKLEKIEDGTWRCPDDGALFTELGGVLTPRL